MVKCKFLPLALKVEEKKQNVARLLQLMGLLKLNKCIYSSCLYLRTYSLCAYYFEEFIFIFLLGLIY